MNYKISLEEISKNYQIDSEMEIIFNKIKNYCNQAKKTSLLFDNLTYFLKTPSKRKRLIKMLAIANLTGGITENVRKVIFALELVNSTIFIHDDIIDHDLERKNKPTLNKLIGFEKALLIGNMLYFLAIEELNSLECEESLKKEIISSFSKSLFRENIGQYLDVHFRNNFFNNSLKTWEDMVLNHSGLYVISAMVAIAKLNGRNSIVKLIKDYEENCTLAGAAEDAFVGLIGSKKPKGDLKNKGFTILTSYALKEKKSFLEKKKFDNFEEAINSRRVLERTREYIQNKSKKSINSLKFLEESYHKNVLKYLVYQILEEIK
ncbi:MAG TPA: polyprenyl synthetase family protein [Candidatus Pacearchaeota archaeon]|nr:polyprenyl synthetase family protein [Candidatus Pacearchaeota archaeon]